MTGAGGEAGEKGGEGAEDLAKLVSKASDTSEQFTPIYALTDSVEEKIDKIAQKIYGAGKVVYNLKAQRDIKKIEELGLQGLPICIAKTQNSLSDDHKLVGRPEGFKMTVRELEIAAGAGFIIPLMGSIMRMPGLPAAPAAENIDIDESGVISGLS